MKRFRLTRNLIGGCAGAVALTLAFSTLCAAQAVTPTLITVTQVKPEMLTEWIDLQKNEVIPALKKAGVKSREVRVGVLGRSVERRVGKECRL